MRLLSYCFSVRLSEA